MHFSGSKRQNRLQRDWKSSGANQPIATTPIKVWTLQKSRRDEEKEVETSKYSKLGAIRQSS